MNDRRKEQRISIAQPLEVYDVHTEHKLGSLVDLSYSGFMLLTTQSISPSRIFQCRLHLTDVPKEERTLNLGVECLWATPSNAPTLFWAGFHIIDISESAQSALEQFIDAHSEAYQTSEFNS
ncbi:PilZ domain-containing protein [Zooshikella ganghwensis]|uniref:PilZ domain-containing protein n=1 Tax=Zooshikella ganghwensis TaxID=202772 RepID=UPI00041D481B|nr:PilZ domain-containing protein [Zooshikella ganghwensis]